ncbi:MAG: ABC transporter permease [Deltaproteobacteria bacterium]|nr:ABC transporter permease [Deltaproteobacteria bacterium]
MANAVSDSKPTAGLGVFGRILKPFADFISAFGAHMIMLFSAFVWLFRRPFRLRLFWEQMEFIGVGSLPIVMLVGFFSGAVSALQAINALSIFDQERWVGVTVGVSLAEELAPVFAGLMITARAGSGIATELGSMRITEQIDALTTFAVNPTQYLITPRVVAGALMVPVLTMAFNIIGLVGAYLVSITVHNLDVGQVTGLFTYWVDPRNYIKGLCKAFVFGLALTLAACYQGFNVRGGAKEVGLATTRSVVTGSVCILVLDYFLIEVLNAFWPISGE